MTYTIPVKDDNGKKIGDYALSASLCSDEFVNNTLLHEYVVMYLANQRTSGAHTKTRGEVKRSGRKLYRQKGTGRARVGDAGSPIRRKGGVAFGPRSEANYSKKMPKKMKRKAFCGALTTRVQAGGAQVLKEYESQEIKTKYASDVLKKIDAANGKVLLVTLGSNQLLYKSFRNIEGVTVCDVAQLNAYLLLTHDSAVFLEEALQSLEENFVS